MNREIKFKAWDGTQILSRTLYDRNWYNSENKIVREAMPNDVRDLKTMEFTGFSDSNEKEIYEGYVLQYQKVRNGGKTVTDSVYFDIEVGSWYVGSHLLSTILFEQNNDDWKKDRNYLVSEKQYVKVIGNIYENSEFQIS